MLGFFQSNQIFRKNHIFNKTILYTTIYKFYGLIFFLTKENFVLFKIIDFLHPLGNTRIFKKNLTYLMILNFFSRIEKLIFKDSLTELIKITKTK